MKKTLLLFVLIVCANVSFGQTMVTNNTNGALEVWASCYDANCNLVNEVLTIVPALSSMMVANCTTTYTSFFVGWDALYPCRTGGVLVGDNCQHPNIGIIADVCGFTPNGSATVTYSPGALDIDP